MRERQEAWKAEKQRKEAEAEQQRQAKEQAEREEQERQNKIQQEIRRAEQAERWRLQEIEWEKQRDIREAALRAKQEAERIAEEERQERLRQEVAAAQRWWDEVSHAQWQELIAVIADHSLKHRGKRATPPQDGKTRAEYGYGVALHAGGMLYGVARPHPGSLHCLVGNPLIFVRSAREAKLILAHDGISADRVIHFSLPDHEQLELF